MNRSLGVVRKAVLAATLAGSLGFGATQAFAKVRVAPPEYICVPNDPSGSATRCSMACVRTGHTGGQCNASYTGCVCYDDPPIWAEW
jgi:hypothetical protein